MNSRSRLAGLQTSGGLFRPGSGEGHREEEKFVPPCGHSCKQGKQGLKVNIRLRLCAAGRATSLFVSCSRCPDLCLLVDATLAAPPLAQLPCLLPACQQALRDLRHPARFSKALHLRATLRAARRKDLLTQRQADGADRLQQRQAQLQQRLADLEAEVRLLQQRLYGRSCAAHHTPNTLAHPPATDQPTRAAAPATPPPRRPRRQQRGRPGHGRRPHDHLPATYETINVPPQQRHGAGCGLPFAPCGSAPRPPTKVVGTVRAHRRVLRRRRYRPTCGCGTHPALIPAPPRRRKRKRTYRWCVGRYWRACSCIGAG